MYVRLKNIARFFLITIGIVFLTSFTIDATDSLSSSQTALSIFANKLTTEECPRNMVLIEKANKSFCIDKYEVSPSETCLVLQPKSTLDTTHNLAQARCQPLSHSNKIPWTFVTKNQALQLCAKAGKRLPTAEEWFAASLGTPDNLVDCNLTNKLNETGKFPLCVSGYGVYDMIGNVWEIVSGEVTDGVYNGILLPKEGYVHLTTETGVVLQTGFEPNHLYNNDYFWSSPTGQFVLMKGGYYGSKEDGGIYATHAQSTFDFASAAVGFRCVKSL
jgi:formylglycine-generating enzyme required for sulfatase activity